MSAFVWRLIRNVVSNVLRGCTGAIVAFALPPLMAGTLNPNSFAVWMLLLQLAAYSNYFDAAMQTAIARSCARALATSNVDEQGRFLSASVTLMGVLGVIAAVALFIVAALVPHEFKHVPSELVGQLRWSLVIFGAVSLVQIPLNAFGAVLIGMEKNHLTAVAMGSSRLVGAGAVAFLCVHHASLLQMTTAMCVCNIAGGVTLLLLASRSMGSTMFRFGALRLSWIKQLLHDGGASALWALTTLVIAGLDVSLVAAFDFRHVAAYALATNAVVFVTGTSGAAMSALIAPSAAMEAKLQLARLRSFILRTSAINTFVLLLVTIPILLQTRVILTWWVHEDYALQSADILRVLLVANLVRLIMGPYSAVLIGAGEQLRLIGSPAVEAFVNLSVSVAACLKFGAIGVAWGTLCGAVVGIAYHLLLNLRQTKGIALSPSSFIRHVVLTPAVMLLPLTAVAIWIEVSHVGDAMRAVLMSVFAGISILLAMIYFQRKTIPETNFDVSS